MIFEYICPPASLYLAFSIIQILIDMFRGETSTAFLKFLVMIIFTIALNMLCASGLGIISWFIVFIPFILMTYITTILVFVFGIPKTSDLRPERKPRNEHNRDWWKHHEHIGGCAGTQYGCCDDGQTAKKISTVQIVHHHLNRIIIKTSLVVAPERNTAVAPTKKPQKKMIKEVTVAPERNTAVAMMAYLRTRAPRGHPLC